MRYSQLIKIRDCVFMTLQWMFSMPVKNINGKNPFLSQILFMCMLLILGADGEEYEVRNMKNSLVSPKELLQISDNVVSPGFLYYYVYFNMGNPAFVCSKELAERNASCRIRPYASTSCQGWQYVSNGSTGYLALNESEMPDVSNLLYCVYQAMPGVLTLYQGSISRTRVDGGWGKWSSWGNCSATCGGGKQYRHRNCNSPTPKYGGLHCSGERSEERICKIQDCPSE
nr:cartilage intermediate layer protein 1-like [Lytechinus pictus]